MPLSAETARKIDGVSGAVSLKDAEKILTSEARKLADAIQGRIDAYYASYEPKVYDRTYNFQNNTLRISPVKTEGGKPTIHVYFDPDASTYNSIIPGGDSGFVPLLIDGGWAVGKDVWFKDIYRFGHYQGFNIKDAALAEYEAEKHENVEIDVNWGA